MTVPQRLVDLGVTEEEYAAQVADAQAQAAVAQAAYDQAAAQSSAAAACRAALTQAVQLAALSPFPTPEEQAAIDAQVTDALAAFRALPDPPADVTALAAEVLTWKVT